MGAVVSTASADIAKGEQTSGAIEVHASLSANVFIPAAFTGSTITFLGAYSRDGTYSSIYDDTNAQSLVSVTTNSWMQVPAEVLNQHSIKVVASSSQSSSQHLVMSKWLIV